MYLKTTKKITLCCLLLIGAVSCQTSKTTESDPQSSEINDLIGKMSIEEKVGQMTQLTLGMFMKDDVLDEEVLRDAIVNRKVGSILNVNGKAYSMEEWHKLITTIQDIAINETENKIPVIYGIDAIHGATYIKNSTLFPHNIGMGASRNLDLVAQGARITALETRASGVRWNFDPTLGIGRQPLWARFEETYGESEYLAAQMGGTAINTYEKDGLKNPTAVASCMKHFLGYSIPRSGKDRTPTYIPEVEMREIFLPPFEAAVANGTSTVMINSGEINGQPVHSSSYYLQDILRDELGFEGVAVTDWEDIKRLHIRHRVAKDHKEAVKMGILAGIDMSMVPLDYTFTDYLIELVNEGEVPMSRIDEAVYRILKLKFDVGLFDNAYPEEDAFANFGKAEYSEVALQAALESITLMKNENNVLPLKKDTKVLFVGPTANCKNCLHGSWSYTWQGNDEAEYPESILSLLQAMIAKVGKNNVITNATNVYDDAANTDASFVKRNASNADVIVLALGEEAYAESPGGIDDLTLERNQLELAQAAIKTGKPVVVLLAQGRPRLISSIVSGVDAVLNLYRPASQGANATMDILFGDYNPNGVLPFSYPKNTGDIVLYDRKGSDDFTESAPDVYDGGAYKPQWAFGHGLSYTTFSYANLSLSSNELSGDDSINVSVEITNEGDRDGLHAVDLYVTDLYASVTPALKKLRKFSKVNISAGQTAKVEFQIGKNDLSMINQAGKRVTERGVFVLRVGNLSEELIYN